jgi:hypothetical protein
VSCGKWNLRAALVDSYWITCGAFLHFFSASKVENHDPDKFFSGVLRFLSLSKDAGKNAIWVGHLRN